MKRAAIVAMLLAVAYPTLGDMIPVSTAGYNRDVVVESSATSPFTSFASSFDVPNNLSYYEAGLLSGPQGLPAGGTFTSLFDGTTLGQLQPYGANNVLFLSAQTGPTGTLTLGPGAQVPYSSLAVFAASTNYFLESAGALVIHFIGGSDSAPLPFNADDWWDRADYALWELGRVDIVTEEIFDEGSNPRIYQTTLDLATLGLNVLPIASIEFTMPLDGGPDTTTGVFGISGEAAGTAAIPEPATLTLLALGGLGLLARRRRRA